MVSVEEYETSILVNYETNLIGEFVCDNQKDLLLHVNFTGHNDSNILLPEDESNLKSKFKCEMLNEFTNYSIFLNFDCNLEEQIINTTTSIVYFILKNKNK